MSRKRASRSSRKGESWHRQSLVQPEPSQLLRLVHSGQYTGYHTPRSHSPADWLTFGDTLGQHDSQPTSRRTLSGWASQDTVSKPGCQGEFSP